MRTCETIHDRSQHSGRRTASSPAPDAHRPDLPSLDDGERTHLAATLADALLRLAALKRPSEARALLEEAWAIAERSRCPRLLRAAGRALAALMAEGREAAAAGAATALLRRTVGVGFGNAAPVLARRWR